MPIFGNWAAQASKPEPEPQDDMAALMMMMRGEFDDQGYYGITDQQQQNARGAGLSALGQSLVAGAMSGSWGQAGLAINQGIAGMTDARNNSLRQSSQDNMNREKYILGREQTLTELEKSKMELDNAKEQHSILKEQRKAVMAAFSDRFKVYEDTIAEMPEGTAKKIAKTKLNEMKIYTSAMDFERAAAAADALDVEVPEIRRIAMQRMSEAQQEQTAATGRGNLQVRTEANAAALQEAGNNYVYNSQGEVVPLSPYQVQQDNRENNSRALQDRATEASIRNYDSIIEDRSRDPRNLRLGDVDKKAKEVHQAIQQWNAIAADPRAQKIMNEQTRSALAKAQGVLTMYGIPVQAGKPITGMDSTSVNNIVTQHLTNTIDQINALEQSLVLNAGNHQPGSPEDSIEKYSTSPGVVDAPSIDAKVNAIMASLQVEDPDTIENLKASGKYQEYVAELKTLLISGQDLGE